MKKSVVLTVVGSILMVLATTAFFLVPWICNSTLGEGFVCFYEFEEVFHDIPGLWNGLIGFKNLVMSIVIIAAVALPLILWLAHLIVIIAKKKPLNLIIWFIFLLLTACYGALLILIFTPGYPNYYRFAPDGNMFGWYSITISWLGTNAFGIAAFIIGTAVLALEVIGYILVIIGYILAMVACGKQKAAAEEVPEIAPEEEQPEEQPEEIPEEQPGEEEKPVEEEAPAEEPAKEEAPAEEPVEEEAPAEEPAPEPAPEAPAPAPVPAKQEREPEVIDIIPPEKRRYRVRMSAGSGVVRYFETKEEAIAYAKGLAKSRGVNVIVKH